MTRNPCPTLTAFCFLIAGALSGCTQFPELDARQTPGVATAPYPALVPLDGLLDAPAPVADVAMVAQIENRVSGLRGRASRLANTAVGPASGTAGRVAELRARAAQLRTQ
ncbi:hypothetical protein [Cognatishimia sp. F0-27]|uniref:hypothetical protein n=1 Tax=Cognatishimia sp. F0-27 TaxID=2816855 RepID=UPI001D0C2DC7|nr:hypothetical protein [Cognatishimia sp. F0-27]MCC1494440.1 hypothetical protein [Cognatishimia sp. F0-27]